MSELNEITGAWEVRYGTDGIGLVHGYVHADTMNEARVLAAFKLAHDGYPLTAEKGLFTVHRLSFDLTETEPVTRLVADVKRRIETVPIADGYRETLSGRLLKDNFYRDYVAGVTAYMIRNRRAAVENRPGE